MIHTIENDIIKVDINDLGAELWSIKGKKTGDEYLWQGNPLYWKDRAINLFPICGRLYNGEYEHNGKVYQMRLHGIARTMQFSVYEKTKTKLVLELVSTEESKLIYPFDFNLKIKYELDGGTINQTFIVFNSGKDVLPFTIGGHPGFNVPFNSSTKWSDYYLEFSNEVPSEEIVFSNNLMANKYIPQTNIVDGKFPLVDNMFSAKDYFFKSKSATVILKSDKHNQSVTVKYNDMLVLGLWSDNAHQAPYICIEPWLGVPATDGVRDDIMTKQAMMKLQPNTEYQNGFSITIKE